MKESRPQTQSDGKIVRTEKLSEAGPCLGKDLEDPGKTTSVGSARNYCVILGSVPYVKNHKTETGCKFGEKCAFMHREVDSPPTRKPKKTVGKGSIAVLKNSRQLGCVFQDVEPPTSNSILRKETQFSDRSAACNSQKVHCAR